jgi:heme oxygenase
MINAARGEVQLRLQGRDYRLCLTLGALAEIEHALGLDDLTALDARLARPSARDLVRILTALLRGGGEDMREAEVERLPLDARAMADAIGRAFAAAGFGAPA